MSTAFNPKTAANAALVKQFEKECHDRGAEIDPGDELCWRSLTVGWAIAKGLSPDDAGEFACYIRYSTPLG
jgi:hypothetical protein